MAQCIFGHVGSISRDFVDSNRTLPNLHGMSFVFSHTLDPEQPFSFPGKGGATATSR
jgi:hypothetical protein